MKKHTTKVASLVTGVALLLGALGASPASAAFEVQSFDGSFTAADGSGLTQAGAHANFTTRIVLPPATNAFGELAPPTSLRDADVTLPAGLIGDPSAATTCTDAQLVAGPNGILAACPVDAQVGVGRTHIAYLSEGPLAMPIYRMQPAPGVPAQFAMNILGVLVYIDAKLVYSDGYRVEAHASDISQGVPILGTEITFWGVPNDDANDPNRFAPGAFGPGLATTSPRKAFMSLPTSCSGASLSVTMRARSWQEPDNWQATSFLSHDTATPPNPVAITGCDGVPFAPTLSAAPSSTQAASPSGLDVHLALPQNSNPDGVATSALKGAKLTLPRGMSVNPSSVDGLSACTGAQIGIGNENPVACPESSKIGTVEIKTPLLEEPLGGSVYLAAQGDNPFHSLLSLYLVGESAERGVLIKLAGKVEADPRTGQLTASFEDNPQLPFSSLDVNLKSGPKAPLITPSNCGTYSTTAELTPWSGGATVTQTSSFKITQGPGGQPCPNGAFDPKLKAGTTNPVAGDYSPFALNVSREDGTQLLDSLNLSLPQGLLGKLAGIPYCPDSALAAVSGNEGSGQGQLASPSCPAASQVGTVSVGAGAGPSPFYVNTGKAYLAGPYKGAPLSLAVVTPAVAGPFDLGSVVVRNALRVDPATAQITAVSDPLPTILHGIPLDLREVRVSIDRDRFTLNPTSCDPMQVSSTITSSAGKSANPSSRFQVASCERLAFKPSLKLKVSGATKRAAYPKLRAELKAKPGEANIAKVSVALPHSEFLAQEHIKTICTRVQYAADQCPAGSIYGQATAWSPLLDQPLSGPVYLRSSSNPLPDLVVALKGQIDIDLAGRIDSVNGGIRNTFSLVPDAPVSKFVLEMQGGKKSLLVNSRNLCAKGAGKATVKMDGQNGKAHDSSPVLGTSCGKKRK
jgi:hypothetical protein